MQTNIIEILNTCFILCLSIGILFLIISVVLFFMFDIRTVYNIRSGRAQAKTVKEMQEANSTTGRLRVGKATQTAKLTTPKPPVAAPAPSGPATDELPAPPAPQAVQTGSYEETQLLSNDAAQTSILSQDVAETSVLSAAANEVSAPVAQTSGDAPVEEVYFEVIKKIICRDTDEVIR